MATKAYVQLVVNSTAVFKEGIFQGKVLFCTGGGSGIGRGMVYAVVSDPAPPFPHHTPRVLTPVVELDETRRQCRHRRPQVSFFQLRASFDSQRERSES